MITSERDSLPWSFRSTEELGPSDSGDEFDDMEYACAMGLGSNAEELAAGCKVRFAMSVQWDVHGADGFEDQMELGSRRLFL